MSEPISAALLAQVLRNIPAYHFGMPDVAAQTIAAEYARLQREAQRPSTSWDWVSLDALDAYRDGCELKNALREYFGIEPRAGLAAAFPLLLRDALGSDLLEMTGWIPLPGNCEVTEHVKLPVAALLRALKVTP